jgi:hypothetical protein
MGCIGSKSVFTSKGKYKTKKKERLYPKTTTPTPTATGKCSLSAQFGSLTNQPGDKVVNGFTVIVEVPRSDNSEEDHKDRFLVEAKTLPNKSNN